MSFFTKGNITATFLQELRSGSRQQSTDRPPTVHRQSTDSPLTGHRQATDRAQTSSPSTRYLQQFEPPVQAVSNLAQLVCALVDCGVEI
ncbi:hypothetical protein EYF80_044920 [Liparis tanakae]|uniref:Uncharacterized protein n=1 Tax=Liparis tanakae TaxID=230148 RepID=A0A4Z2FVG4_9TELE|nr:hypothetical protein EYF80_044920 [Liparis tanakae]